MEDAAQLPCIPTLGDSLADSLGLHLDGTETVADDRLGHVGAKVQRDDCSEAKTGGATDQRMSRRKQDGRGGRDRRRQRKRTERTGHKRRGLPLKLSFRPGWLAITAARSRLWASYVRKLETMVGLNERAASEKKEKKGKRLRNVKETTRC